MGLVLVARGDVHGVVLVDRGYAHGLVLVARRDTHGLVLTVSGRAVVNYPLQNSNNFTSLLFFPFSPCILKLLRSSTSVLSEPRVSLSASL